MNGSVLRTFILLCIGWQVCVTSTRCFAQLDEERHRQFEEFKATAEKGDAIAQHKVGCCYDYGNGVAQDTAEAARWYQKAAEQGHLEAQYDLASAYHIGRGVQKDRNLALKWHRKAAENGYARSQFVLASKFSEGEDVPKDYAESVKWAALAAEKGNVSAMILLGDSFENGKGVSKDHIEAYKWFDLAVEQGDSTAIRRRQLAQLWLTATQIEEGRHRSEEYAQQKHLTAGIANGTINGVKLVASGGGLTVTNQHAIETVGQVPSTGSSSNIVRKYRGKGSQVEGAGSIAATYITTTQIIEACEKHGDLKSRAQKSLRDYLHKNHQVYMDVMRKLPALALANGGNAEVQRLKAELDDGFTYIEAEGKKVALEQTKSVSQCTTFLDSVDKGMFDLKIKHFNEVRRILE